MTCGVYRIYCKVTTRSYIGSSKHVSARFAWHRAVLRRNSPSTYGLTRKHPCQEDWNTFGENAFQFQLLEECELSQLKDREQHYMNLPDYVDRYNADVSARGERKCSEQTKQWMSDAAKERNMRPEYNAMISKRSKEQHALGKLGFATWKPKKNAPISKETEELLLGSLEYDENLGRLRWKITASNYKYFKGDIAGVVNGNGRRFVTLNYKSYGTDNVTLLLQTGEWPMYRPIHINGDLQDDRFTNLRVYYSEGRPRSLYPGV